MKIQVFITKEDIGESLVSFESEMKKVADFAKDTNIEVSPETVKTDVVKLPPPHAWVCWEDVAPFMRSKIKWYMQNSEVAS